MAKIEVSGVPTGKESWIGRILWFSVGGCLIKEEKLQEHFDKLDIPPIFLPSRISVSSAFKKAIQNLQEEKQVVNGSGKREAFLIRPLTPIKRELVREQNINREELRYAEIGSFELKGKEIESKFYPDKGKGYEKTFDSKKEMLEEQFNTLKTHYDGKAIRDMLRNALKVMNATALRPSGGVYFVLEEYSENLQKFVELCRIINENYRTTDYETELYTVPVVNTKEQRDYVKMKYEGEIVEKLAKMTNEMRLLLEEKKEVSQVQAELFLKHFKQIKESNKKYETDLNLSREVAKESMNVASMQLEKLMDNVKAEEK